MTVSYKKLWKLLIDKDLMKKDLQQKAGISWATMTKMSKGEVVSTEVLEILLTLLMKQKRKNVSISRSFFRILSYFCEIRSLKNWGGLCQQIK